jgi:DNA-binding CsgD family transcriptional regulator
MARRGRPPHPDILTPREWDVLALLREGATNEQIAARLGITERTAKFHVSEILGKLGVNRREEAAAWQPERKRTWWLPAGVPIAFFGRKTFGAGVKGLGVVMAGGMLVAVVAGAALLAVLLVRSNDGATTVSPPLLAFSAGGSIYTVQPDGTGLRKIIGGDRASNWNASPAFSPDGSQIAFTRDFDIWIANAGGSNARSLATVAQLQTPPAGSADDFSLGAQSMAWSPDGERIAYVLGRISGSGVQDLWVMNADGSERKELSREGGVWEQPVWLDSERVSVVAPGKIVVFSRAGAEQPAQTFDSMQQFGLAAQPVKPDEWLVGPITEEGPITLGSPNDGRKTVATGVAAALAPDGAAFAYFADDTMHIAEIGGRTDEQILDLAPLGGRDHFFGEASCVPNSSPACSYRLPVISWTGPP